MIERERVKIIGVFCIVRSRRYLFAMFKSFESLFNLLHPKSRLQVDLCNIALLMRDVIIY